MIKNLNSTYESQILARNPQVRELVSQSPEFQIWKQNLKSLVIDGVKFYIRGGDMLKDEDQIICEWVRKFHANWLPEEA